MLKLLIADDEYFIRERLKKLIDYHALGYELAGEADNGEKAYKLLKELKPDLAILDIQMPLLSGLELAQKIYTEKLDTKVIILTSFDYFSYAQESIHYGVFSYLLKPVDKLMLTSVLKDASAHIMEERHIHGIVDRYQAARQSEAFLEYLQGETLSEEHTALTEERFCSFPKDMSPALFLIRLENPDGEPGISSTFLTALKEQALFETIYSFICSDNICGFLAFEYSLAKLRTKASYIPELIHNILKTSSAIAASPADLHSLQQCFATLFSLIQQAVFLEKDRVYWPENLPDIPAFPPRYLCGFREPFLVNLRAGNTEGASEVFSQALYSMALKAPSAYNLSVTLSEFFLSCSLYTNELHTGQGSNHVFYVHELTENYLTLEGILDWCRTYLNMICCPPGNSEHASPNILVSKVTKLIETSYADPSLDLSYIADHTGYTASYLSSTFKRITGFSVVQYITKYRIEAARSLLSQEGIKLKEVCEKIGYSDVFYFSKRFKSFFGYSPSEYMKIAAQALPDAGRH